MITINTSCEEEENRIQSKELPATSQTEEQKPKHRRANTEDLQQRRKSLQQDKD